MKKIILLFFCILALSNISYSAITLYSSVSKDKVGLNEDFTFKLTVAGVGYFPNPKLPTINSFHIHQSGQITGTDFSSGSPIPYTIFEYILTPVSLGKKTIPSVAVEYKGSYYYSKPIDVAVSESINDRKERARNFYNEIEKLKASGKLIDLPWNIDEPVFVISNLSKDKAYFNEQLIYTLILFTRVPILQSPKIVLPEYESFHQELLDYRRNYLARISGKIYQVVEYKTALFPFMTGERNLPKMGIKFTKDCFDENNVEARVINKFTTDGTFTEYGKDYKVNVSPIPLENKPLDFSGLIGSFDISTEVDSSTIRIDGSLVLTVHVKGEGNIRSIPDVQVPIMDKLGEYNSATFLNFNKKNELIKGEKLFQFLLVPRDLGIEKIPSIGFSYYDTEIKDYKTKWTNPIEINILEKQEEGKQKNKEQKNKNYINYLVPTLIVLIAVFVVLRIKKRKTINNQ